MPILYTIAETDKEPPVLFSAMTFRRFSVALLYRDTLDRIHAGRYCLGVVRIENGALRHTVPDPTVWQHKGGR